METIIFDQCCHPRVNVVACNNPISIGGFSFFPYKDSIYFVLEVQNPQARYGRFNKNDPSIRIDNADNMKINALDCFFSINNVKIEYDKNRRIIKIGDIKILYTSEDYVPTGYISKIIAGGTTYKYDWRNSDDSRGYYEYRIFEPSVLGTRFGGVMVVSKY